MGDSEENVATGVDLLDEPLELERGYVRVAGSGGEVEHEHRVKYDHDPPVEFDARFFGTMVETRMDFDWAGYEASAIHQFPTDELREFIKATAPRVGLEVDDA
ncbi:hypothetical protein [Halostella sp. PRR32]|uniref:hypothetical protein n=1 Tax=Halostella sp. PRR32 TaxID=3098147 RepID=UPI002B1E212D|nr:hypothetical protein [Halostella sp. PRR32]